MIHDTLTSQNRELLASRTTGYEARLAMRLGITTARLEQAMTRLNMLHIHMTTDINLADLKRIIKALNEPL